MAKWLTCKVIVNSKIIALLSQISMEKFQLVNLDGLLGRYGPSYSAFFSSIDLIK